MNVERAWKAAILKRVVLNSFAGAFLAAIVGALCSLSVVAILVWLEKSLFIARGIPPTPGFIALFVLPYMASFGLVSVPFGAIVFSVAAARAKPGALLAPLQSLIGRVLLGQIIGTIGFCSLYLSVEAARAAATSQLFCLVASKDMNWLILGTPALMSYGAIAGALSKRT